MDDEWENDFMCDHGCLAYECSICEELDEMRATAEGLALAHRYPASSPQAQLHRVHVRAFDALGNELQRTESEPITRPLLAWMRTEVRSPCTIEFCIEPPLPVAAVSTTPLEYAVWEPLIVELSSP